MKPSSASSDVYCARCRAVSCGSARNTGPDLVDPLEDADHQLLVELRRLGQVGRPAEVVEPEHVRAALGGRRRRSSACGSRRSRSRVQRRPGIRRSRPRRSAARPRRAGCRSASAAWSSWVGRVAVSVGPVQVERRRYGDRAEHPDRRRRSARPRPGAAALAVTVPVTSTTRLLGERLAARGPGRRRPGRSPAASRTIRNATDLSSRRRCTQPATVHGLADVRGQLGGEDALHGGGPPLMTATRSPGRCGRAGSSRCHHTFTPAIAGGPLVVPGSGVSSRPGAGPPSQLPVALSAGVGRALLGSVTAVDRTLTAGTAMANRIYRVT